jgi:Spy/CpxP family protein refolding chaperone
MKKAILLLVPALMLTSTIVMAQCPGGGLGDRGNMMIEKRIEMGGPDIMMMGQGRGMGRGQWWENDLIVKEIGLTDEQSKRIDALATAHRKEMIKLEADLKIAKMELDDLFENMENESVIRKKAQEVSKLKEKIYTSRIDHRLAMHKVLTAEQQKKMKTLKPMRTKRIVIDNNCEGCGNK